MCVKKPKSSTDQVSSFFLNDASRSCWQTLFPVQVILTFCIRAMFAAYSTFD